MPKRPHVIRQGEYVTQLAHRLGVPPDELWSSAENDELRQRRSDRDMLQPGDVIQVPDREERRVEIHAGATNRYRARVPKVPVRVVLRDGAGRPLTGLHYAVRGGGRSIEGTTDGEGAVSFTVPVVVRQVTLEVEGGRVYHVTIGGMDPASETSGIDKRLAHLGYLHFSRSEPEGPTEIMRKSAISSFQKANGLRPTGQLDQATRDAIVRAHGS